MSKTPKSFLKIKSSNFDPNKDKPIRFEMTITFGQEMQSLEKGLIKDMPEDTANDQPSSDSLFIKFKSDKKVSSDLQAYIEEYLGMYELIEDEKEKIFVFELKINDIDI